MTDLPPLTIVLLTYNRLEYAKKTLKALTNFEYEGAVYLHIADDGSLLGSIEKLFKYALTLGFKRDLITTSNSERSGYGGNYNLATQVYHSRGGVTLMLEDDWELIRPVNFTNLVRAMWPFNPTSPVECIRLGYLGWTQPLRGELVQENGITFLLFDKDSPEPHVWAGHPRLESVERQRAVGEWPERLGAGETEFAVAHMPRVRQGVGWPMSLALSWGDVFAHFGTIGSEQEPV